LRAGAPPADNLAVPAPSRPALRSWLPLAALSLAAACSAPPRRGDLDAGLPQGVHRLQGALRRECARVSRFAAAPGRIAARVEQQLDDMLRRLQRLAAPSTWPRLADAPADLARDAQRLAEGLLGGSAAPAAGGESSLSAR
jgi:hypothetical protein